MHTNVLLSLSVWIKQLHWVSSHEQRLPPRTRITHSPAGFEEFVRDCIYIYIYDTLFEYRSGNLSLSLKSGWTVGYSRSWGQPVWWAGE